MASLDHAASPPKYEEARRDLESQGLHDKSLSDKQDSSIDNADMEKHETKMEAEMEKDPFGDEQNADVKYKTMAWWQAGMLMIAETISLGVLSLPSALATLGLVPGVVIIVVMGFLATYTGFVIGQFKQRYPGVHSMADAGAILGGKVLKEILGAGQLLFFVLIMGSHILTFTIMMNVLSDHGTCTIVFSVVGLVVSFIICLPRQLEKMSFISIPSFISIIGAVMITMIAVGIKKPIQQSSHPHIDLFTSPSFVDAFLSVCNILFAFSGHVAFFSFISELRVPRDYPKALCLLQASDCFLYLLVGITVYVYVGRDVESPALNSAGHLMRKVAYGVACPTILIAGVVNGHVACKYVYVRLFRNTSHMGEDTFYTRAVWVGICFVMWTASWVIAEAVPVFNDLLGLTSALFASWFTIGLVGMFWLYLNRGQYGLNWKKRCLTALNIVVIIIGTIFCVVGLYATAMSLKEDASSSGKPFSCADNS